MSEIIEEIIGKSTIFEFDLDEIPLSLTYKLEEGIFTFSPEKFGINEWKHLDWYERRMPRGLLQNFPCLYYMVEEMHREATKRTPLEEIMDKKNQ
jgi:hypothetical protein